MPIDGQLHRRRVTSLPDHRVVDPQDAMRLIHRIKELLASPALLFIETKERR